MLVELNEIPEMTLEGFADLHGLVMEVNERPSELVDSSRLRYYAKFKGIDLKDGPILSGVYGNGSTPNQAIRNYAPKISEKLLVFDAYGKNRKVFQAPRIL